MACKCNEKDEVIGILQDQVRNLTSILARVCRWQNSGVNLMTELESEVDDYLETLGESEGSLVDGEEPDDEGADDDSDSEPDPE